MEQRIFLICIRFGSCEVRRLNLALPQRIIRPQANSQQPQGMRELLRLHMYFSTDQRNESKLCANLFFEMGADVAFQVIYQTRATVFHRDIQTLRRELKIRRGAEYF